MSSKYTMKQVRTLIAKFTGQNNVISCPRIFVDMLSGNFGAALLLNQIIYWSERTSDPNGWFYKSYKEWQEELGITEAQVRTAVEGDKRPRKNGRRPTLKDFGVKTKLEKAPNKEAGQEVPTLHYQIDWDVLIEAIMKHSGSEQCQEPGSEQCLHPGSKQSAEPSGSEQCQEPYITETTTESSVQAADQKLEPEDTHTQAFQDSLEPQYVEREAVMDALSKSLKISPASDRNRQSLNSNAKLWISQGYSVHTVASAMKLHNERFAWKVKNGGKVAPPNFDQLLGYAMETAELDDRESAPPKFDPDCKHGCTNGYIFEDKGDTVIKSECECRIERTKEKVT